MRKSLPLLLSLALGGFSCGGGEKPVPEGESASTILARVNGEVLTQAQFEVFLAGRPWFRGGKRSQRESLFREFLVHRLLLQEADRREIEVEPDELPLALTSRNPESGTVGAAALGRAGDFLRIQKLIKSAIGESLNVTLADMRSYYLEHPQEFVVGEQVHVLEILLTDAQRAREVRSQLEFGQVRKFSQLARRYSVGVTARSGGDLGRFERGQLPEDYEKVIFALKPGEVSPIFRSGEGYHIFMLEERIPGHPQRFYEVQERLFRELMSRRESQAFDRYLKQLIQGASIEVLDPTLRRQWGDANASAR